MSEKYQLLVHPDMIEFLDVADEKTERIIREHINQLRDTPYPGRGKGDKEKIVIDGEEVYRNHVGRTLTIIYDIDEERKQVLVDEITTIKDAHDRYGWCHLPRLKPTR